MSTPNTPHRPVTRCLHQLGLVFRRRPTLSAHLCAASAKFRGAEACHGVVWRLNLRGLWQARQWFF